MGEEALPAENGSTPGSRQLMVEINSKIEEIHDAMAN